MSKIAERRAEETYPYPTVMDLVTDEEKCGQLVVKAQLEQSAYIKGYDQAISDVLEFFYDCFNIHPHDCHVVQYDSDTPLEELDDVVEQFKQYTENKYFPSNDKDTSTVVERSTKMKANELMIGDWVRKLEKGGYSIPAKIMALYENNADCLTRDGVVHTIPHNGIEPLLITQQILEKNGFEIEHGCTYDVLVLEDADEDYRCVFHQKEKNYTNNCYNYIHLEHGCVNIEELPIEYVHELQHILRLCGINKEITL